jgi:hypothetical protein
LLLYFPEQELHDGLLLPVVALKLILQVGWVVHSYISPTVVGNESAVKLAVELSEGDFVGADVHVAVAVV